MIFTHTFEHKDKYLLSIAIGKTDHIGETLQYLVTVAAETTKGKYSLLIMDESDAIFSLNELETIVENAGPLSKATPHNVNKIAVICRKHSTSLYQFMEAKLRASINCELGVFHNIQDAEKWLLS
jgi:hypothetical protein